MQIRHRHFSRGDEKQLVGAEAVHVVLELGKLSRAGHHITPHQQRRLDFDVAVLARVQIEHEVDEPAREARAQTYQHRKSRPRELRTARQIEDAELLRDLPMRLAAFRRRRAPTPNDGDFIRHLRERQVRNEESLRLERRLDLP